MAQSAIITGLDVSTMTAILSAADAVNRPGVYTNNVVTSRNANSDAVVYAVLRLNITYLATQQQRRSARSIGAEEVESDAEMFGYKFGWKGCGGNRNWESCSLLNRVVAALPVVLWWMRVQWSQSCSAHTSVSLLYCRLS